MGSRRLLGAGRQQRANFCNLPGIASCSPVQRVRQVGLANLATAFDGEGVFVYGWLKLSVGWEWLTFHILFGRCFLKYVFVARVDLLIHLASWPFLYKLWFLELILLNFPKLQKLVVVMPDTSPQMGFSCQVPSGLTQPCTLVPKRGHEPVWRHWNISFWKDQGIGPAWKPIAAKESRGEYIYIYLCENPLVNTWCCFLAMDDSNHYESWKLTTMVT